MVRFMGKLQSLWYEMSIVITVGLIWMAVSHHVVAWDGSLESAKRILNERVNDFFLILHKLVRLYSEMPAEVKESQRKTTTYRIRFFSMGIIREVQ